jgi:hypothetical protein
MPAWQLVANRRLQFVTKSVRAACSNQENATQQSALVALAASLALLPHLDSRSVQDRQHCRLAEPHLLRYLQGRHTRGVQADDFATITLGDPV